MSQPIKVNIKLDFDIHKCQRRFEPLFHNAQKFLDNQVLKDSDPYVPFDTGATRQSGINQTKLGEGLVVYKTPYVRYIYYGLHIRFRPIRHPLASAMWFEKAKAVRLRDWVEGTARVLKSGGKPL